MTDDTELTLRQAANLRQNVHLDDESARMLAELKQHAKEIHGAYEKLKTVCVQHGMDLEDLLS